MTGRPLRFFQVANGQGAGNIGDELMNRAFWDALPPDVALTVEVFPHAAQQREPYPSAHRYVTIDWEGRPAPEAALPALLVGDTPVTDTLGVSWPLGFLAPRLARFHEAGLPVDALGVGVEPVRSAEGRALFRDALLPVRSWTVRSARCRERLLELGVPDERIAVGADWAWRYRPRADRSAWAGGVLRTAGWDGRRLLLVSVVNEVWGDRVAVKRALAEALDAVARAEDVQVAFFCNETRPGAFYDQAAAAEVRGLMRASTLLVPPEYYTPDEALALVAHAAATVSSRYHFTVQSTLAGRASVTLTRSEKMTDLLAELGHAPAGTADRLDAGALASAVSAALREDAGPRLAEAAARLGARAAHNLDLWWPRAALRSA